MINLSKDVISEEFNCSPPPAKLVAIWTLLHSIPSCKQKICVWTWTHYLVPSKQKKSSIFTFIFNTLLFMTFFVQNLLSIESKTEKMYFLKTQYFSLAQLSSPHCCCWSFKPWASTFVTWPCCSLSSFRWGQQRRWRDTCRRCTRSRHSSPG